MDGFSIWRTGRSAIDWEPAWVDAEIIAPTMRNLEIGIHTLGMMPCAGANGPIDDLVLENIVSYEVPSVDRYPNGSASTDFRSENWRLENIVCPSGVKPQVGPVFRVPGIDGIQVLDCHVPVQGTAVGVQTDTGLTGPAGPSTRVRINPAASVQFPFSP